MKIFCPVDFSETSINAAIWITRFLDTTGGGALHLSHFIFLNRRSTILLSLDDMFKEKAEEDMDRIILELKNLSKNVEITYSIHMSHPKEGVINYVKKNDFDLIVSGTTGLTALKDILIGSVTEYIFDHSPVPVLAIPKSSRYSSIKNIAIAADDGLLNKVEALNTITKLCQVSNAKLHLVHVTEKDESPFEYDPAFDMYFKELDFSYERLQFGNSLAGTLNTYCDEKGIDILGMIHHKTNWFKKLFIRSSTKSELYKFQTPLLVLNEL